MSPDTGNGSFFAPKVSKSVLAEKLGLSSEVTSQCADLDRCAETGRYGNLILNARLSQSWIANAMHLPAHRDVEPTSRQDRAGDRFAVGAVLQVVELP